MIGGMKTMFEHVIYYDASVPFDELMDMYEYLESEHGKGKFLFLPNSFTYSGFSICDMKMIRDQMDLIIKEYDKKMKIIRKPDTEKIQQAVKDNDGYCPCRPVKTPETKCMCKEFLEQKEGTCHCGLYEKIIESDEI